MAEKNAKDKLGEKFAHHIQCRCVNPTGIGLFPMDNMPTSLTAEFDGLVDSGDLAGARDLIQGHISSGSMEALFLSSTCSWPGEDLDDFETRSLREVEIAASKGYAPAIYRLGCYYRFGDFVEVDVLRAVGCFELAAKAGLPAAMYEYGLGLLHGDGASPRREDGLHWIRKAADCGDASAEEFLLAHGFGPASL